MKVILCLFGTMFALMFLAFLWAFIKAWFWEIVFRIKKRKAIKENSPDKWIYKI